MSTLTAARPGPRPTVRTRGAVAALARTEALRLLRHPAFLASVAAYLALWAYDLTLGADAQRYPVLQDSSRTGQPPLLLIAAGTLLAADFGVLRGRRHGVEPVYAVLVLGRRARAAAHLLALLPAVALAAALAVARILHLAALPGAVGTIDWAEVATGPAAVLFAGVLGVLLARLSGSLATASLTVAGLAVLTFVAAVQNTSGWRWLTLVAIEDEFAQPLPSVLLARPAGWHLLWLAALSAVCAAFALLRDERDTAPGAPSRTTGALWTCAALAAVLAALAGALQLRPVPDDIARARTLATEHPAREQDCSTRGHVTYCAFPEFTGRIRQWDGVVRGILHRTPAQTADARYAVRQRLFHPGSQASSGQPLPQAAWDADDRRAHTPGAVPVGTWWSAGSAGADAESDAVAEFSALFAYRTVTGAPPHEPRIDTVCGSRAVLTLWLAGQATDETRAALRDLASRTTGGLSLLVLDSSTGLAFDARESTYAVDLLKRPADDIGAKVRAAWSELTAPDTTTDRAATLLGVPAPPQVPAGERTCR
ncbi:ABC transporter permease [Streptomyces sp. NPDC053069]|uniref:ABC transporter permease n=1 Tax=Streptomyces sp. NPDC053069 TaxID=3365695 RepID=UPI0037D61407